MSGLDPMIAGDGQPVYTALVKPMADGTVSIMMLVKDGPSEADQLWALSELRGEEALVITSALASLSAGTGASEAINRWIDWHGGLCPVPYGTLVDIRYRDGAERSRLPAGAPTRNWRDADARFWVKDNHHSDIVAYRLAVPHD